MKKGLPIELQGKSLNEIMDSAQKGGANFIVAHPRCALIMGMGRGKTLTTLAALNYLKTKDLLTGKILIASTPRIAENVWKEELDIWKEILPALKSISVVTGTEKQRLKALTVDADAYTISVDSLEWLLTLPVNLRPFKTLILDELSLFKNSKIFTNVGYNRRCLAAIKLSTYANRVIGLTGTPISNGSQDLFTEYFVLDKGQHLGTNRWAFIEKYFNKNEYTGARIEKPFALKDIETRISPITYTVKGIDEENNFSCFLRAFDLPDEVMDYYERLNNHNACTDIDVLTDNGLTKDGILRQLSSCFIYKKSIPVFFEDSKIKELKSFMEETGDASILIFVEFKAEVEIIKQAFPKKKIGIINEEGAINLWNNKKLDILIASPKSAAHGLNLQSGGYNICFFTMPLSAELFYQAIKRLARRGQRFMVNVCCLSANNTRDAERFNALKDKGITQAQMIERLESFVVVR